MDTLLKIMATIAAGMLLAACNELPQDKPKPFAGKAQTRFDDAALAVRANHENEYLRMGDAPKP